jgi:hypothetical protein
LIGRGPRLHVDGRQLHDHGSLHMIRMRGIPSESRTDEGVHEDVAAPSDVVVPPDS